MSAWKIYFPVAEVIFLGFLKFAVASTSNPGDACPQEKYPWYDEKCVNASGIQNPCMDIRECDFTDAILALGGWPTVCGWIEEKNTEDQILEWPKVCCGMHLNLGDPLKKEFVKLIAKKTSSTTQEFKAEIQTDVPERKNNIIGQCVLPLVPLPDTSVTAEDGIRFGNTPSSRQEFTKDDQFLNSIMHDSIFSMDFKTSGENGVLFYVSANRRRDYIALFMQEGKIIYAFDCGLGSAVISSTKKYNDNAWHKVVFLRQAQKGELVVDTDEEIVGRAPGKATRIDDLKPPLYVGGLPDEIATKARHNLQGVTVSFPGCIRKAEAQGELLGVDTQITLTDATGCSSKVEDGTFFSADGGYIILYERYRVGQHISISMEIKPRNMSGILVAIHGIEDYLILQLVNGRLQFTVENGDGPVTTTYTPSDKNNLCDGQFHTINAESKSNNNVILTVDGVSSEKSLGGTGISSTDTFDPLYVGGLPEASSSKTGVLVTNQFVGCVRNLKVNDEAQPIQQSKLVGAVTFNSCPTI